MNDELKKTTRIVRRPKVKTDDCGRTVRADIVETANLELVSTQMLQQLIDDGDDATMNHLREVAEGKDGLLAHDADRGRFEIISDEELQHILNCNTSLMALMQNTMQKRRQPTSRSPWPRLSKKGKSSSSSARRCYARS